MNSHLVTIEVGVERSANQWMQLDGLAFDQNRFKCLNTQSVQGRRTVQHNRMFANDFFQNIPDNGFLDFNQTFGCLNGRRQSHQFQFVENERFEQFQRHQFWQTALMQFQLWTDSNNGTAGIVDTFTQQVLTETTAFTLDHFSQ